MNARSGVSPVYNWESGKVRIPQRHLSVLADLFQLEQERLRSLLTHPAAPPRPQAHRPAADKGLDLIAVSRHCLGRWERGAAMPPLHALRRLARLYTASCVPSRWYQRTAHRTDNSRGSAHLVRRRPLPKYKFGY